MSPQDKNLKLAGNSKTSGSEMNRNFWLVKIMLGVLFASWASIFIYRFQKILSNCKNKVILQGSLNYARALKPKPTFLQLSLNLNLLIDVSLSLLCSLVALQQRLLLMSPSPHLYSSFEISWRVPAGSTRLGTKLKVAFASCVLERIHIVPPPRAPKAAVLVRERKQKFT